MTNLRMKLKMWVVAKIKNKNLNTFVYEIKAKISDIQIYYPKIEFNNKHKNVLGDYIFCYHKKFRNNFHLHLKYLKGLIYFLENNIYEQNDLKNFIKYCIFHEDRNGLLKSSFFKKQILKSGKFLNGPFSNYLFDVAIKEKNKLKVLIGNFRINISDENNILYQKI